MSKCYSISIIVFFDDPFWAIMIEKNDGKSYSVCKVVLGSEPKDYEVFDFLNHNYYKLKFSPKIKDISVKKKSVNPKRAQREIKKRLEENVSNQTKSQRALSLLHEENKIIRKTKSKEMREKEKERKFELRQKKKINKHKGR